MFRTQGQKAENDFDFQLNDACHMDREKVTKSIIRLDTSSELPRGFVILIVQSFALLENFFLISDFVILNLWFTKLGFQTFLWPRP